MTRRRQVQDLRELALMLKRVLSGSLWQLRGFLCLGDSHTLAPARIAQMFFHEGRYRSMCGAGGDAVSACKVLHRGKNVARAKHTTLDRTAKVIRDLQIGRVSRPVTS